MIRIQSFFMCVLGYLGGEYVKISVQTAIFLGVAVGVGETIASFELW